jgi:hypothetical protein
MDLLKIRRPLGLKRSAGNLAEREPTYDCPRQPPPQLLAVLADMSLMTIQSLSAGDYAVSSAAGSPSCGSTSSSQSSASSGGTSQSQLSPAARLLSELQKLEQQDPAEFQQVTASLASTLQNDAQQAQKSGSTSEASALNQLASAFSSASQTGDLSSLQSALQQQASGTSATSDGSDADNDATPVNPNLLAYQQNSSAGRSTVENLWSSFQATEQS